MIQSITKDGEKIAMKNIFAKGNRTVAVGVANLASVPAMGEPKLKKTTFVFGCCKKTDFDWHFHHLIE